MIKIFTSLVLLIFQFTFQQLSAQGLKNNEYIQLQAVQKRSGNLVSLLVAGSPSIKYYFRDSTVLISINEQYSTEKKYTFGNKLLKIDFTKYIIDSLTDETLVMTDVQRDNVTKNMLRIITYLNTAYLFDYLKQTQRLILVNDSVIQASSLFSPTYAGDIVKLFIARFKSVTTKKTCKGTFVISSHDKVNEIQVLSSNKFTQDEIEYIRYIIKSTEGSWLLPPTPKPFDYKINFALNIDYFSRIGTGIINFTFH